jgi:CubicO group peptidase (beta-lactamase class C family)
LILSNLQTSNLYYYYRSSPVTPENPENSLGGTVVVEPYVWSPAHQFRYVVSVFKTNFGEHLHNYHRHKDGAKIATAFSALIPEYGGILSILRFVLLFTLISFTSYAQELTEDQLVKKLDSYLTLASSYGFSGSVLVAKQDKILLHRAYGMADRIQKRSVDRNSVYDIGSVTKQFTAAAIMKLETQGKLNTTDSLTKYFENVPEDKKKVTLHHLLTHTAGFPEYSGDDYVVALRDDTVESILNSPLEFEPGSSYFYSNAGYSVLAAIVEKVSGQSYESFLNEYLFRPAGMKNTGYRIPNWEKRLLPHGYFEGKDLGTPLDHLWSDQGPYWNLLGNGGILSTVSDLYLWHQALQGDKILFESAKKKMYTPALMNYAYGWVVRSGEYGLSIGHSGASDNGFNAGFQRFIDRDVVIIAASNAGEYLNGGQFSQIVATAVAGIVMGKGFNLPEVSLVSVEQEKLQKFHGSYQLTPSSVINIKEINGELTAEPVGQGAVNLVMSGTMSGSGEYDSLNRTASLILDSILKKDYAPLRDALQDPTRTERYKGYIENDLQEWQKEDGELKKVTILGTVPTWWDATDADTVATFLRFEFAQSNRVRRLHWKGGKIIGFGGGAIRNPSQTPLRALSDSKLLGYHLVIGQPIFIERAPDGSLKIQGTVAKPVE